MVAYFIFHRVADLIPLSNLLLDGESLTTPATNDIAALLASCVLAQRVVERMQASRLLVEEWVCPDRAMHGVFAGFGEFRNVAIGRAYFAGAMGFEALLGTNRAFDPRLNEVRAHPGHCRSARKNLRRDRAAGIVPERPSGWDRTAYSLRCIPQVQGAS